MLVDLILENAQIHTGHPSHPLAKSIAVLNGRVVALDTAVEGLESRERINLKNRVVLPGFNDVHAHTVWYGMTLMETDLSRVGSIDDIYRSRT